MDHYSTFFCLPPIQLPPSSPQPHQLTSRDSPISPTTHKPIFNGTERQMNATSTVTNSISNSSSASSHSSPHSFSSPSSPLPNSCSSNSSSGSAAVVTANHLIGQHQGLHNLAPGSPKDSTSTTATATTTRTNISVDVGSAGLKKTLGGGTDIHPIGPSVSDIPTSTKATSHLDHESGGVEPKSNSQSNLFQTHSNIIKNVTPHNSPPAEGRDRGPLRSSPKELTSGNQSTPPSSHRLVSRIPSRISTSNTNSYTSTNPQPIISRSKLASIKRLNPLPSPEVVQATCDDLMAREQCFASATHSKGDSAYGFRLSGSFPQVMAARGRLLREQPFEVEKIVAVQRSDVLQGGINVPPAMKAQLDEIASSTRAHLSIVGSGDGSEGEVDIVIRGDQESAEEARIRLLILLDQLNGLHLEVCEIDYKLHYIIAGRKRSVIQSIQEETATNIYFPSLLSCGGILGTRYPNLLSKHNMIVITGEFFDAQRAREMLFQVSVHKSKCIISRDTTMHPRKLDWMLMEKLPTLQKIMNDNGTFINFPPIGSQASAVSVYGDHRVQIERTIRTLMQLACEFYTADVWLLPGPFQSVYHNGPQSRLLINSNEIAADGHRISTESGAEIVFKSTNSFEVYGTDRSVKKAIEKILELDLVCKSQVEVRFQVELACEHRDFISGKKNGKLNKIMKTSNVKIKFEPFNDYNFLIDVSGDSARAMAGLKLLEEELPAEISFHIPEGYHKRIIGVGGKNIQRIMKKYGVYVKFTNAEEFASLGGYLDNHDNVVARTPAKNSSNLQNLKDSVMELVHPNDKDFVIESMVIDRQNHRSILAEKSIFIHDIELKTNTCFYFPSSESGLDKVAIFGPRSKISIARQMLVAQLGLEADYKLCCSAELLRLVRSEEFEEKVTSRIKRSWGVTLSVLSNIGDRDDLTFRFTLSRSAPENLKQAQETLEAYLIEKKFNFQPETGSARSFQRRSTVTSIGSADRSTSAGAFTPITPTDPLGFGYNIHYSGEKETDKVFGRPSTASKHTPSQSLLSNSTSSASSLLFHPNLFTRGQSIPAAGLQGSYSNGFGPGTRNGSLSDWKSSPRQISRNAFDNPNFGSPNDAVSRWNFPEYSAATQGLRGGISASNLQNSIGAPGESVSRRFVASPRAQSIDLGKPSIGGNMMMSLFGSGGTGSLLGSSSLARGTLGNFSGQGSGGNYSSLNPEPNLIGAGIRSGSRVGSGIPERAIQAGGLHRHRFSQGTISSLAYEQNLINGLGGLKH